MIDNIFRVELDTSNISIEFLHTDANVFFSLLKKEATGVPEVWKTGVDGLFPIINLLLQ